MSIIWYVLWWTEDIIGKHNILSSRLKVSSHLCKRVALCRTLSVDAAPENVHLRCCSRGGGAHGRRALTVVANAWCTKWDGFLSPFEKDPFRNGSTCLLTSSMMIDSDCGRPHYVGDRIQRGQRMDIEELPWMVSVGIRHEIRTFILYCSGFIVSGYNVITAAHCVSERCSLTSE